MISTDICRQRYGLEETALTSWHIPHSNQLYDCTLKSYSYSVSVQNDPALTASTFKENNAVTEFTLQGT